MSFTTRFLNLASRLRRSRPALESKRPAKVRLLAERLETRNLLSTMTILDSVHVHFEMNFANGAWQPFDLRDDTHDIEYDDPTKVLLYVAPADLTTQQAGFNFVGAGQGNPFYETPLDTDQTTPYMSLAVVSESIPSNTFNFYRPNDPRISRVGEWIKLEMLAVQGPGYVSSWQDAQIPLNQWWMSSYDGGRTLDPVVYVEPGDHIHVHWGFTQPGIYHVTYDTVAFYGTTGLPLRSDPVTLTFGVNDYGIGASAAPLPAPVAVTAALGTAPQTLNPSSLPTPVASASALPSTPSTSTPANGVAVNAPLLGTAPVDGVFSSTPPRDHGFILIPGASQQAPGQPDGWLGDVLQNEGILLV